MYDAINRFASAETRSIDFDFGWRPADGWDLHFKVGYTDAEGNTDNQPFVEFGAPATFTYDLRGKAPQVSFANVDPTDPNDMQFIFSSLHQILNDDEEKYGYVDATRELEWGALNSIKFGAKYTNHERDLVFNAHHVRRLPRADQQHAGLAVSRAVRRPATSSTRSRRRARWTPTGRSTRMRSTASCSPI